jgi:hypothetical protein
VRRGLLYAGTETGIYVSFDDGDHWQPLQMNLPVVSVRDITIHGDDVVIATHGRSFWILDDVTSLREAKPPIASEDVHFYKPQVAIRTRPGNDEATPYPPETPHGDNPALGATLDYYLKTDQSTPISLEILDAKGASVRKFTSDHNPTVPEEKTLEYPARWVKLATPLVSTQGAHRFVWDLHYEAPAGGGGYRRASGVWVLPGEYTAVLTVAGKSYKQPLTVRLDPRLKTPAVDLQRQFAASQRAAEAMKRVSAEVAKGGTIEKQLASVSDKATVEAFQQKLVGVLGKADLGYGAASTPVDIDTTSLRHLSGKFRMLLYALQSADAAPTPEQESALAQFEKTLAATEAQWKTLLDVDLKKVNEQLKQSGQKEISQAVQAEPEIDDGDNDRDR